MTTDPITLAREVLDLTHEDETVTVCTIPDNKVAALARTVVAVAALADRFEAERETSLTGYEAFAWDKAATLVRTALNGDNA